MAEPGRVIRVATAAPYDVVVGQRPARPAARRCSAPTCSASRSCFPEDLPGPASPVARRARAGVRRARPAGPAGRGGQDGGGAPQRCWEALGARRLHPQRRGRHRRRRSDHRPRRLRRRDLAARRARRARARPRCSAWSTRRSAARPASTPRAGKNLVGVLPRAGRRALRPRPARHAARRRAAVRARRGGQVRLHRRPGDPAAWSRTTDGVAVAGSPVLRELVERAVRVKADVVAGDLTRDRRRRRAPGPRGAQLRPHDGRTRSSGRATTAAARRGRRDRHGLRRRAGPARPGVLDDAVADRHRDGARPGRAADRLDGASFDDLPARMAVDKKSRGSELRFVVLDGLARPADPGRPERGAPARGVRRDDGRAPR